MDFWRWKSSEESSMRNRLMLWGLCHSVSSPCRSTVRAQAPRAARRHRVGPRYAKPADLSGDWAPDGKRGGHRTEPQHLRHPRREARTGRRHSLPAVGAREDDVGEDRRPDPSRSSATRRIRRSSTASRRACRTSISGRSRPSSFRLRRRCTSSTSSARSTGSSG